MPRSVGITISAVVVIIGSAFTIFLGAMMVLGSLFMSKSSPTADMPANLGFIVAIEAAVLAAFGGWGVAAGIGLIKLKQWARISVLVFAAILLFISLPAAVLLAFVPLPNTDDPNLPSNFMAMMRAGIVFFYAVLAALGGFWLYFFNKRSVKAQFNLGQPALESAAGMPIDAPGGRRARPLSITIIGWFLIVSCAFVPIGLISSSAFFSAMPFPVYFLGFFFSGRTASLILIMWMTAQIVAAVGLLRLKKWGLFGTVGLQCLTIVNAVMTVGIPANRAKFQQITETMMASMNPRPQPVPFVFPMWIAVASSLPVVFVILWFLITRRQAFTQVHES